jgi:UDP-N-acetylmuramoylalanine-D-glutamate ligase
MNFRDLLANNPWKRVLILGYGKTGKSAAAFFKGVGAGVVIFDDQHGNEDGCLSDISAIDFDNIAFVVQSPGIPINHPVDIEAKRRDITIFSDIDIFMQATPNALHIGITGTNGKSTTTALIGHVLKKFFKHVFVCGNIGSPVLSVPIFEDSDLQFSDITGAEDAPIASEMLRDIRLFSRPSESEFLAVTSKRRRRAVPDTPPGPSIEETHRKADLEELRKKSIVLGKCYSINSHSYGSHEGGSSNGQADSWKLDHSNSCDPVVYVIELSSYQLELSHDLHFDVGVLTNLAEDHLARHGTIDVYIKAKEKILSSSDICAMGLNDGYSIRLLKKFTNEPSKIFGVVVYDLMGEDELAAVNTEEFGAQYFYVKHGCLCFVSKDSDAAISSIDGHKYLLGNHNKQNIALTYVAVGMFFARLTGISFDKWIAAAKRSRDEVADSPRCDGDLLDTVHSIMQEAGGEMRTFCGLPHRLEVVKTIKMNVPTDENVDIVTYDDIPLDSIRRRFIPNHKIVQQGATLQGKDAEQYQADHLSRAPNHELNNHFMIEDSRKKNVFLTFVNDSKATNAVSTIQALKAFEGDTVFLIAGGRAKDDGLLPAVQYMQDVAAAFLIGESAPRFASEIDGYVDYFFCNTLQNAVMSAYHAAISFDRNHRKLITRPFRQLTNLRVILLSPACASFDQFSNFEERGDAFKSYVENLC